MATNRDKILTLLRNNMSLITGKKNQLDREAVNLENRKQLLSREINDANKQILLQKDLIKEKKWKLISRSNEHTYGIVRAKLAKDKEVYFLEKMRQLFLKRIYDVTHSDQIMISKTSINAEKWKLIRRVDENVYVIIKAKLNKEFDEKFGNSAIRKKMKKEILDDIDEKNAPTLAKLNVLKSKLSILENKMSQDERELKKVVSTGKDIYQESIKINGLNKILESYIDIINENNPDTLMMKMIEIENDLKKIVDESVQIEVELEKVKHQLDDATKLQIQEIKKSAQLRNRWMFPATWTRSAEDEANLLCREIEKSRRTLINEKEVLSYKKNNILKEFLLVRWCFSALRPEYPLSTIVSDDMDILHDAKKKEKEFINKKNFIHVMNIFATDCQMIQYIKDLMKTWTASASNFSRISPEKHIELLHHFTRTQSLVYYLELLDKNNLLLNNPVLISSMTAWYAKNKNVILWSFKNIDQQSTNYFYYICKKLGLFHTDIHKKNHLAVFW